MERHPDLFRRWAIEGHPVQAIQADPVLEYLVSKLENRVYSEEEINAFLRRYHPDFCTLRREFIMNRLMVRKEGKYKICIWNQSI